MRPPNEGDRLPGRVRQQRIEQLLSPDQHRNEKRPPAVKRKGGLFSFLWKGQCFLSSTRGSRISTAAGEKPADEHPLPPLSLRVLAALRPSGSLSFTAGKRSEVTIMRSGMGPPLSGAL